jgi:hypothetical protein
MAVAGEAPVGVHGAVVVHVAGVFVVVVFVVTEEEGGADERAIPAEGQQAKGTRCVGWEQMRCGVLSSTAGKREAGGGGPAVSRLRARSRTRGQISSAICIWPQMQTVGIARRPGPR